MAQTSGWLNPAFRNYQARRWARERGRLLVDLERLARGGGNTPLGPGGGAETTSVRTSPLEPDVAYVVTSIPQPYGESVLLLYPSSLVRTDQVNAGVAWLTVTDNGT